ncbi:MAG: SpoIIE family protein phosphatase [Bacteroidales bacterium]|nr:SpoIIE family protein phosphatase [Bacteroidales bacterium]
MNRAYFLILFALLNLSLISEAKTSEILHYNTIDGLSQTNIKDVFLDKSHYLWIGTNDGLNVFNGYEFKTFKHNPENSASISGNIINRIGQDKNGNLWVATNNGVNIFNFNTGEFSTVYPEKVDAKFSNNISNLQIDQNYAYIISENYLGRFLLNGKPDTIIELPQSFFNYEYKWRLPICVNSRNHEVYFSNRQDIFKITGNNELIKINIDFLFEDEQIHTFYSDTSDILWIGTSRAIYAYRMNTSQVEKRINVYDEQSKTGWSVFSMYPKSDQTIYLGTNNGIIICNTDNGRISIPEFNEKMPISFRNSLVTSIEKDSSNNYWFGAYSGLLKYHEGKRMFNNYSTENIPSLPNNIITSIYKDKNNRIWAGCLFSGLSIINKDFKDATRYYVDHENIRQRLSGNRVNGIYELSDGDIFISTGNGLAEYDPVSEKFMPLVLKDQDSQIISLLHTQIYKIEEDLTGNLWMGTSKGLFKYNIISGITESYFTEEDSIQLSVTALLLQNKDTLWLGTQSGLVLMIPENGRYTVIIPEHPEFNPVPKEIYSMYIDKNNINLWLGTNFGLCKFDRKNFVCEIYNEDDGFINSFIYNILEDEANNLWLSTNKGLIKFNYVNNTVQNYTTRDGLINFEYNTNAAFKSSDGEFFFGGISGFSSFYPDSFIINNHIPPLVITKFNIIQGDKIRDFYVGEKDTVYISYSNNYFDIYFAALDYTAPDKNQYRYSITKTGKKPEWTSLGNKNNVVFAGMDPGTYLFQVLGSNNDLVWNTEGKSLIIIIETPFWKSTEAKGVYILIFLGAILFFFRMRTRSLRVLNREYKEREKVARKVALQKEELTLINKNITDSINYARRIQEAMMPSKKIFKNLLPESFIIHEPKDIVSGDFYWIGDVEGKTFIAAVDCTGHGVPGAFMSIIGFELFRRITTIEKIQEPARILNSLNEEFKTIFSDVENIAFRDGMDLAFCTIDIKNRELEFAGAFNSIYIIRENTIIEIKGDRFSVGLTDDEFGLQPFKNHVIPLQNNDMLYLFTDGFADQFGGPEGKKYKYRRFRHLLLAIHQLPMEKQKYFLQKSISEWKGDLDQVDDILVIGTRIILL